MGATDIKVMKRTWSHIPDINDQNIQDKDQN